MTAEMEVVAVAMILYKTGDPCPCCGQPIKLKSKADLYAFSAICELTGLNSVARTQTALQEAAKTRREVKMPEAWV